ncbi:MAG: type III-A CRISPR-associated protein Csm2 [Deltaproteobacteria bacterium]|nr:MAG: type III-A CRISPR-associated protein Csm2 [Deltaproteobacteria bacterium]RLB94027.1 MAG: type III-A CRISPR-associated protein Csm2 [Deltaproteobacteria bacterium]HDG98518.1 type III-A CRISPR-associated protein Csm2 [Desulfobacterales bacterium]
MANIRQFIQSDESAKQMVEFADDFAGKIAKSVSTSQIRNIYGTVKKLEMTGLNPKTYRQLLLLKPKLAYAKGRANKRNKNAYERLETIIGQAIDAIDPNRAETFTRFCQFFEAILAYHKAHGGE